MWEFKKHDRLQLVNLPAVGYNFKDGDPIGWVDARFDPAGVSLTTWNAALTPAGGDVLGGDW